jgi:hypothetical protein
MTGTGTRLTREEIDAIADALSADDIIEGTIAGDGAKMLRVAFNRAAARAGYGDEATTRVGAGDFKHWAQKLGEVVNAESPLSEGTESLLGSAATGA